MKLFTKMWRRAYRLSRRSWPWQVLFAVWLGAIYYASSMTGGEVSPYLPTFTLHKLAHFVAFSSGAVILALALRFGTGWRWRKIAAVSIAVISLCGAADELHQRFTPGRDGTARDWAIDTASGAVGVGVLLLGKGRVKRWVEREFKFS